MAQPSRSSDGRYSTTDLVLASYLCSLGFDSQVVQVEGESVKPGHPQGAWVYQKCLPLSTAIEDYDSGAAKVEPQSFHEHVTAQRRRMFKHLRIGQ